MRSGNSTCGVSRSLLVSFLLGGVMAVDRDPDWRDAIERLREESNHVLREIWAAKRRGLEDPEDEPADESPGEPAP